MHPLLRPFGLAFPLLLLAPATLPAQPAPERAVAPPTTPLDAARGWFYENSDIPMDPAWVFGALPNGVRYAVRRNGVPPGQVSIRVRMDVGSLDETSQEAGWAHLMEHISFRGSRYVPDGESKRIWQRLGASFGTDTNAATTPVSTTYKLDLPSARPAGVEESLKILAGMMFEPSFDPISTAAETKVVGAELREGQGPERRVNDRLRELFFAGQPFAQHDPIGTVETLANASPDTLKAFHDRWYRPDRAVVVIAGDIDPAIVLPMIERQFGGWKAAAPAPAPTDLGVPDPGAPRVAVVAEPSLPARVEMAVARPWRWKADTVPYNQGLMRTQLALQILNRRLESQARAGASFLAASVGRDDVVRSADVTSVSVVPAGDSWSPAVADVRAAIADAIAIPPTQAEIDREATEYEQALVTAATNEPARPGAELADDLVGALDIAETSTTAAGALQIFRSTKPSFTPAAIQRATAAMFEGAPMRALLSLPATDAGAGQELLAAIDRPIAVDVAAGRKDLEPLSMDVLPALGPPATVAEGPTPLPGADQELKTQVVRLSNGVTLVLFPNDSEAGRIYVDVRFGTGLAGLGGDKASFAWSGEPALVDAGLAGLNLDQLDRLTTGRQIGMSFAAEDTRFSLSGTTRREDLGDQLRFLATKLSHPSWNARAVERIRDVLLASYGTQDNSAYAVVNRDLEGVLHGGDPRWAAPDRAAIGRLTADRLKAYWSPVLAEGSIEVAIFGDFDRDTAIREAARTFGALKPRPVARLTAAQLAEPVFRPTGEPIRATHTGPADQAAAVLAWPTGAGLARIEDSYALEVLAAAFGDRLLDRLRSEEGESYSPQVFSQWPRDTTTGGSLVVLGQVRPGRSEHFFGLSREIAADLVARPISADEFARAREPVAQNYMRAFSGNTFWLRTLDGVSRDPRIAMVPERLARALGSMTPADVQRVAARYLRPDGSLGWVVTPRG